MGKTTLKSLEPSGAARPADSRIVTSQTAGTSSNRDELHLLQPDPGAAIHVESIAHLSAGFQPAARRRIVREPIRPERLMVRAEPFTPALEQALGNLNPQHICHRDNVAIRSMQPLGNSSEKRSLLSSAEPSTRPLPLNVSLRHRCRTTRRLNGRRLYGERA